MKVRSFSQPSSGGGGGVSIPLLPYQKMIVAHGILCVVGFLGILPAGALLARYLRTFSPVWFKGHHLLQLVICEYMHYILPGVVFSMRKDTTDPC